MKTKKVVRISGQNDTSGTEVVKKSLRMNGIGDGGRQKQRVMVRTH